MFDFQNLEVYKQAKSFHSDCKALFQGGRIEKYVVYQLGRASLSIALNIAEGSGKFSKADRRNFYIISRASLFECVATLDILHDEKCITNAEFILFLENQINSRECYSK